MLYKEDLANRLAHKNYTKGGAREVITDVFDTILEAMAEGEDVMIRGFGTFEVKDRAARDSVSPATGEICHVEPFKAPAFYPGKHLKHVVRYGMDTAKK